MRRHVLAPQQPTPPAVAAAAADAAGADAAAAAAWRPRTPTMPSRTHAALRALFHEVRNDAAHKDLILTTKM